MPPSFDGRGPAPGALSAYRFVLLSLIPLILIVLLGGIIEQAQAQSAIALVQDASKDAGVTSSSSLAFPAANIAGHWIGVVIRAGQAGETFTVSDSRKNTYHKAVQFNETGNGNTRGFLCPEYCGWCKHDHGIGYEVEHVAVCHFGIFGCGHGECA